MLTFVYMNEDLIFREAVPADAERIMQIIRQAQAQMKALGSAQWQNGYPALANIENDIAHGYGYVLEQNCHCGQRAAVSSQSKRLAFGLPPRGSAKLASGLCSRPASSVAGQASNDRSVIAYGAAVFDGEPTYAQIDGAWLTDGDFVVLHRLAVADEAKRQGVAVEFFRRVEQLALGRGIRSFRVDTNFDNRYMLALLQHAGFTYCGKVFYAGSGERLAFEKQLKVKS